MGPVRGDSQKALLFCVWPQEVSHWSSNDNTQKNRTTVTSCPVSFLLSHFHLLLLPSWAIFGSINMLKYIHDCSVVFTYIPLRKNGMYYSHLQPQMPKNPINVNPWAPRYLLPLPPSLLCFLHYTSSVLIHITSSQASSPSDSPALHLADSNVYSAIKTQPIKGNGSTARHWRGGRSCKESGYKSLWCRP